jgi:hypothetical protein
MAIHQTTLEKLQHFTLCPATTITAIGNQTGVDLAGYEGEIQIILVATAAGSGATFDVRIEESADNSSYAAATGGGFTQLGNAYSKQVITLNASDLKRYIRMSVTTDEGTGSSVMTCVGYGTKKYG